MVLIKLVSIVSQHYTKIRATSSNASKVFLMEDILCSKKNSPETMLGAERWAKPRDA